MSFERSKSGTARSVDSVLIANTYHELAKPLPILRHVCKSLRHGGHLVVVHRSGSAEYHEVSAETVELHLRNEGFEIESRTDSFTRGPDGDSWWVIVAAKP